MYPTDAQTVFFEQVGAGTSQILPTNTYTFLGVSIQQPNGTSHTELFCGGSEIIENAGADFAFSNMHYLCNNGVTVTKTGNGNSTLVLTYVSYDMTQLSTSTVYIKNGFTYGEALIVFVLLLIFSHSFFIGLKDWLFGQRIDNFPENKKKIS